MAGSNRNEANNSWMEQSQNWQGAEMPTWTAQKNITVIIMTIFLVTSLNNLPKSTAGRFSIMSERSSVSIYSTTGNLEESKETLLFGGGGGKGLFLAFSSCKWLCNIILTCETSLYSPFPHFFIQQLILKNVTTSNISEDCNNKPILLFPGEKQRGKKSEKQTRRKTEWLVRTVREMDK